MTADIERFDYGPLQTYEITWKTGHVEKIQAHQVSWPGNLERMTSMFGIATKTQRDPRVQFHAELNGRWTLLLSAIEDDIRTIRNVLTEESLSPLTAEGGESK